MKKIKSCYSILFTIGALLLACACGRPANEHSEEEEEEHHHHAGELSEVEVSETQMQTVGIKLGEPESRLISETVRATGELSVNPADEAVVAPLMSGRITKICVKESDRVVKGTVIAYIDAPEATALQEQYMLAKTEEEAAATELRRQEALAAQGAGIRKNLDNARSLHTEATIRLQAASSRLHQYGLPSSGKSGSIPVKAEIGGIVTEVISTTGAFADMQTPIAKIVDTSNLYCTLNIFEKDLTDIKPGQEVEMKITNNEGISFKGKVIDINPVLDPATKTAPVRVSVVPMQKTLLIPGMGVTATVSTTGRQAMALPESAIVRSGGKSYIFVLEDIEEENGQKMYHFAKEEVICGATALGYTEFTPVKSLKEGAKIAVDNAFFLNSMSADHGEHSH